MALDATRLLYFETAQGAYTFPEFQESYSDTFSSLVLRTDRMPGLDGGFDNLGSAPAPGEIGQVRASFVLIAEDRNAMVAMRDAVRAMRDWGKGKLFMQPSDSLIAPRFCYARINSISMAEDRSMHTDLMQPFSINFQVSDPRWLGWPDMWYFDSGEFFDNGLNFIDPRLEQTINTTTTVTLTNNGKALTPVVIRLKATSFMGTLRAEHLDAGGEVIGGWVWTGSLDNGETLIVDGERLSVIHDKNTGIISGYPYFTALAGTGFIQLRGGDNSVRFSGGFTGNVALEVDFYDGWR
jgi:hypothetical protein